MTALEQLAAARVERARLDEVIRAGLVAAVDAGASFAEVAAALGVSRQATRQMYERAQAKPSAER